jgi:acyl carrier protein
VDELRRTILDYVVREYLEEGDERTVGLDTPLISGGIVDSFSMISLKRFLERRCEIQIPDAEASAAAFDSVNLIAELVERLRAGALAGAGRNA